MSNIVGQVRKDEYNPDEARKMAARVARKSNRRLSQRKAEKIVAKVERQDNKKKGIRM